MWSFIKFKKMNKHMHTQLDTNVAWPILTDETRNLNITLSRDWVSCFRESLQSWHKKQPGNETK